jgi:formate hydrogenlyase subunit 3/multisubunit Na+/H+ antiporter MnhD subunit
MVLLAVVGAIQLGIVVLLANRWKRRIGRAWIVAGILLSTVASQAGWYGIDHGWLTSRHRVALDMIALNIGLVCCFIGILASARAKPRGHGSVTKS